MAVSATSRTPVNSKDERFFKGLGSRIAQARKDNNLTQQQVADQLGIAQHPSRTTRAAGCVFPPPCCPCWPRC